MVIERGLRPRRARRFDRTLLVTLSWFFDWHNSLVVFRPATLIRWQRNLVRYVWRWKSRSIGRPRVPPELRALIRSMSKENPSWAAGASPMSCESSSASPSVRVPCASICRRPPSRADENAIKPGLLSYQSCTGDRGLRLRRIDDGGVSNDLHTRRAGDRIAAHPPRQLDAHPTAAWTTQQLREVFVPEHPWSYLLHDRDAIFSAALDETARSFGLAILKSPPRCPKANAFCERLIVTLRRNASTGSFPLSEGHLRSVIREWATHYNRGWPPHSAALRARAGVRHPRRTHSLIDIAFRPGTSSSQSPSSAARITNTRSSAQRSQFQSSRSRRARWRSCA
jgi:hypothetical protein